MPEFLLIAIIPILGFIVIVLTCISISSYLKEGATDDSKAILCLAGICFVLTTASIFWMKVAYHELDKIPYQVYNFQIIRTESDKAHFLNTRTGLMENLYGDQRFVNENEYMIRQEYKQGDFYKGIYMMERSIYKVVPKNSAVEKL